MIGIGISIQKKNDSLIHLNIEGSSGGKKGAHYSKNWTKEKQNEYNHWYYLNKIKKGAKDLIGITDEEEMDKLDDEERKAHRLQGQQQSQFSRLLNTEYDYMESHGEKHRDPIRQRHYEDVYYKNLDSYYDKLNKIDNKKQKINEHYANSTIKGRIKNRNTVANKAARGVGNAVDNAGSAIGSAWRGDDTKVRVEKTAKQYKESKARSDKMYGDFNKKFQRTGEDALETPLAKMDREEYQSALKDYYKAPGVRLQRLGDAGKQAINAIIGR